MHIQLTLTDSGFQPIGHIMVEELHKGVKVQLQPIISKIQYEGCRGDVESIHLIGFAEIDEVLYEVLLVGDLAVKLKVVEAQGGLVETVELRAICGLGPLEMHQRQFVVLLPDLTPVQDATYQLVVVSSSQMVVSVGGVSVIHLFYVWKSWFTLSICISLDLADQKVLLSPDNGWSAR